MLDKMIIFILLAIIGILFGIIAILLIKLIRAESRAINKAKRMLNQWKEEELKIIQKEYETLMQEKAKNFMQEWKLKEEERIKQEAIDEAKRILNQWKEEELKKVEMLMEEKAKNLLQEWKQKEEEKIREDAIAKSMATILGRVGEQLAPIFMLSEYGINPKDLRFLGSPIDYIVFKGISEENPEEIIFVEVKTRKSVSLNSKEKKLRELVEQRKVKWMLLDLHKEL